jgi:hypothetical protein
MPGIPRDAAGGLVHHCLNRAVAPLSIFETDGDSAAFVRSLDARNRDEVQ